MFTLTKSIFALAILAIVIPFSLFAAAQPITGLDISVKCHGNIPPCPKKPYTYKIYQGLNKPAGSFTIENLTPGVSHSIYINGSKEPFTTFIPKSATVSGMISISIDNASTAGVVTGSVTNKDKS